MKFTGNGLNEPVLLTRGHTIRDFFDKVYLSYELNMEKPNPDIFEFVLSDASIQPAETLFLDDAQPNCRTAESLGINTYMPEPREDWSHLFKDINVPVQK